jgi:hypothetical protein
MPGANNGAGSGNYGSNGGENGSAVGLTRPQFSSLGGVDANANSVYIEGIFNREPQNAYIGVVPPIEAIQEVQVYAGKYDAEYGFSAARSSTSLRNREATSFTDRPLNTCAIMRRTRTTILRPVLLRFGATSSAELLAGRSLKTSYSFSPTTRERCSGPAPMNTPVLRLQRCTKETSRSCIRSRNRLARTRPMASSLTRSRVFSTAVGT